MYMQNNVGLCFPSRDSLHFVAPSMTLLRPSWPMI
jgi:hypothetical protein